MRKNFYISILLVTIGEALLLISSPNYMLFGIPERLVELFYYMPHILGIVGYVLSVIGLARLWNVDKKFRISFFMTAAAATLESLSLISMMSNLFYGFSMYIPFGVSAVIILSGYFTIIGIMNYFYRIRDLDRVDLGQKIMWAYCGLLAAALIFSLISGIDRFAENQIAIKAFNWIESVCRFSAHGVYLYYLIRSSIRSY